MRQSEARQCKGKQGRRDATRYDTCKSQLGAVEDGSGSDPMSYTMEPEGFTALGNAADISTFHLAQTPVPHDCVCVCVCVCRLRTCPVSDSGDCYHLWPRCWELLTEACRSFAEGSRKSVP